MLAVLVAVLCLTLPGTALAKSKVSFSALRGAYHVASGANLTISGHMRTKRTSPNWSMHSPLVVQWKVNGVWRDVLVTRLGTRGNYRFTLVKPRAGDYRILFPGCRHYLPRTVHFDVRRGTSSTTVHAPVKLPPLLSIRNMSSFFFISRPNTRTLTRLAGFPVTFDVETSQSPEAMTGSKLYFNVAASVTGATYTPVYSFPSPLSFTGKPSVSLVATVPVFEPDSDQIFSFYKVTASWLGNRYTTPGTAVGVVEGAEG